MVKVTINNKEYQYDGYTVKQLDKTKEKVIRKWDGVFYVGGYEGDGKSVFAEQAAFYVDPSYCLDRCVFTPEQFIKAVNEAKPFQAIVYDEAQDVFESTNKDKMAKTVKSMMTRIRKKQLYIFIVAPDFWRINKYLFIHRSMGFFRIYSKGLNRGFVEYYNRTKKHELKIRGQKNESLCVPPLWRGGFGSWRVLNEDDYDAKKEAATQSLDEDTAKKEDKYLLVEKRILLNDFLTGDQKAELLGVSRRHIYRMAQKYKGNQDSDQGHYTIQLPSDMRGLPIVNQ